MYLRIYKVLFTVYTGQICLMDMCTFVYCIYKRVYVDTYVCIYIYLSI